MPKKKRDVLDLSDADWSETPEAIVAKLLAMNSGPVEINAASAQAASVQTAQVLLACKKTLEGRGDQMQILDPSDPLTKSLDLLGLREDLIAEELTT